MDGCCLKGKTVGVSILNSNLTNIVNELSELIQSGIDFVHLDVMDGNFVTDITFGPFFIASLIREFPGVYFEVHMMVKHPFNFIQPMNNAGVHNFIFHYEVTSDYDSSFKYSVQELIDAVRDTSMSVSLAINPKTSEKAIFSFLDKIDSVLVMTVEPGLGGQKFMVEMMDKCRELRLKRPNIVIGVDGGVSCQNIHYCLEAGVDRAVSGSALLRSNEKETFVKFIRNNLYPKLE